MPNSATEKLLKILKLEAERGYQDKAVTRGLASFATAWLTDSAKANVDPAWAATVADEMRAYSASSDITTRRAALSALINRLQSPVIAVAPRATPPTQQTVAPAAPRSVQNRQPPQFAQRGTPIRRAPEKADNDARPSTAPPPIRLQSTASVTEQIPAATVDTQQERIPDTKPAAKARSLPTQKQKDALAPRAASTTTQRRYPGIGLDAPVSSISGIGEFNSQRFAKLGVKTIRDLLYYFPTRYDDYSSLKTISQLEYGESVTIIGRIASAFKHRTKSGLYIIRVAIEDQSDMIECSWFTSERALEYMMKQFQVGRELVISGKVTEYLGKLMFQNPAHEPAEKEWVLGGSIVPVYRLTEGLQPLLLRRTMKRLIEYWPTQVPEHLPDSVRRNVGLMPIAEALREIHWPRDLMTREQARRRLAFDELFVLQMAIVKLRHDWQGEPAQPLDVKDNVLQSLKTTLPYTLTGAQDRAIAAIATDMQRPVAMHRLLQGDVGSGKTVVAALAIALAAATGAQSALMAPTEILAEQHFGNLQKLFGAMVASGTVAPIQVRLLTGSTKAAEKREIYNQLSTGAIHLIIGTHALIQEAVAFNNLGLVVVDEQHRFGVEQRKALRQKGRDANPHTLVMTATPIPRTLALTLYGDLDNTVLDEMPPGRQPIETHWFPPTERERAYGFVRQQVALGRQAFIICPLVEESDKVEAKAAVEEHTRLQRDVFSRLKLGLLHGRMKQADKDEVMGAFARGELDILVSTSVVEVGIDVANATVMMIEGANRFGLSQLHQFRGRVGRGQYSSYCLLIADTTSALSDERLQAIVSTQDGFKLAEKDLEIRGPGEFFGTRQSGEPELKLVNMRDRDMLLVAREQAERIITNDPQLNATENQGLATKIISFWSAHENHGDAS